MPFYSANLYMHFLLRLCFKSHFEGWIYFQLPKTFGLLVDRNVSFDFGCKLKSISLGHVTKNYAFLNPTQVLDCLMEMFVRIFTLFCNIDTHLWNSLVPQRAAFVAILCSLEKGHWTKFRRLLNDVDVKLLLHEKPFALFEVLLAHTAQ